MQRQVGQIARTRRAGDRHTLRCGTFDAARLKPAQLVEATFTKRWSWRDDAYASGGIDKAWFDANALDLEPLALRVDGLWDLNETYDPFPPESPHYELWRDAAAEPRDAFEFDGIASGAALDPDTPGLSPISTAAELVDQAAAREMLMDALLIDLRCIDAHVHLGNQLFDSSPEEAVTYYEIAIAIGELSLGDDFRGSSPGPAWTTDPSSVHSTGTGSASGELGAPMKHGSSSSECSH